MATQLAKPQQNEAPEEFIPVARVEQELVTFIFTASSDKMKLFIECEPKTENTPIPMSRVTLLGIIPKNVSVKHLHPEVLDDIANELSHGKCPGKRRIAKGVEPVPGRDGKVVVLVKTLSKSTKNPEFVDPWFVKSFDNIHVGMPVARVYKPHPGAPGIDVLGASIPPSGGEPVEVELDQSLELRNGETGAAFSTVYAKIDGYLQMEKGKLQIFHDLVINGDIDHHTGDIQFIGKVVVKGSVKKNFRLDAKDGIEIQGDVLDGILCSANGDIVVKGNVTGSASRPLTLGEGKSLQQLLRVANSKSQIISGKMLKASVLEGVSAECIGDIEIAKGSNSCFLRTRASLRAPKAQIVGGEIYSVCGVEAAILGSELETPTKIVLCSDRESTVEYATLVEKIKAHDSAEEMIRLYLGPYAENPSRIRLLNPEHRKKMESLRTKLEEVMKSKEALAKQKAALLDDAKESTVFRVNFNKTIFPGVRVEAGELVKTFDTLVSGAKTIEYFPAENRFDVIDQQPLQCHLEKKKR